MEGSPLLLLLEKVLTGRPGDSYKHTECYNTLHKNLLRASVANLRAAIIVVSDMNEKKILNPQIYNKFIDYLKQIIEGKKSIPPNINYLTFSSNPASKKTALLFHAINKIQLKRILVLKHALEIFKKNSISLKIKELNLLHKQEIKRVKCSNLITNLKINLKINIQKALVFWKNQTMRTNEKAFKRVIEKAGLRIFYIKYLCFERWEKETWDIKEIVDNYWEENKYIEKKSINKIKKEKGEETLVKNLKNVLISATNSASFIQNFDYNNRLSILSNSNFNYSETKSKLDDLVMKIGVIMKKKKEIPKIFINNWNRHSMLQYTTKTLLRSILKSSQKTKKISFLFWKRIIDMGNGLNKSIKAQKFVDNLNIALKRNAKIVLHFQKHQLKRNRIIRKCYINICKNLKSVFVKCFAAWIKSNNSLLNDRKIIKKLENSLSSESLRCKRIIGKNLINAIKGSGLLVKLNSAFRRIVDGTTHRYVRKVLGSLFHRIQFRIVNGFNRWKEFLHFVNKHELLTNIQTEKLKNALNNIIKRNLRVGINKIIGQGNLLIGCLTRINLYYIRKPRIAVEKWKKYMHFLKQKKFLDMARTQKLRLALSNINFRTQNNTFQYILGHTNKIRAAFYLFSSRISRLLKIDFQKWKKFVSACDKKLILDSSRSKKLENALKLAPQRILSSVMKRILGNGDIVKATLWFLNSRTRNRIMHTWCAWKDYIIKCNKKVMIINFNCFKLHKALSSLTYKRVKGAMLRITGAGNMINGALACFYNSSKRKPKHSFDLWRHNTEKIKKGQLLEAARCHRLKFALKNLTLRTLTTACTKIFCKPDPVKSNIRRLFMNLHEKAKSYLHHWKKINEQFKEESLLNTLTAKRLSSNMEKIPLKTLKNACSRIFGCGLKIKYAITLVALISKKTTRKAFNHWISSTSQAKKQQKLLKIIQSLRLSKKLESILKKPMRKCLLLLLSRIIIRDASNNLNISYLEQERKYMRKWKSFS